MKVRELIRRLQKCPLDADVWLVGWNDAGDLVEDEARSVSLFLDPDMAVVTNASDEHGTTGILVSGDQ